MLKKLKAFAQFVLGITIIRKIVVGINVFVLRIASSLRIFSILYHFLFFFLYSREQHAVLKGKYHYYKNLGKVSFTDPALRRNIHRIEKGLVMQPLRDSFALNYMPETVEHYARAVNEYNSDDNKVDVHELEWARDVLKEYFNTVKKSPVVEKYYDMYSSVSLKTALDETKSPYQRGNRNSPVSYEDLLALSLQRRSVRWFKQKAVPRELIDKALLVARQSSSACNRLPYEFRIFDDPKLVRKVSAIPFGAAGYHQNIPVIIVVVGKLDNYFSVRDRHLVYVDASLAATPFMYALETLGLASSGINWPDFEPLEIKMQKSLGLTVDERPIMLIAVGYPDPKAKIPYSEKKSLEALRSYNKLGPGAKL